MDFASILNGLQQMSERDKIILFSLMDRQRNPQAGEGAKIERYIGQMIIDAAREKRRVAAQGTRDDPGHHSDEGMPELRSNRAQVRNAENEGSMPAQMLPEVTEAATAEHSVSARPETGPDLPFKRRRANSLVTYLTNIWQPPEMGSASPFLRNS